MVCVPWFDQEGVRRPDSLHAQSHAMAEARRLGACPVAPLIEAHRGDQDGWHRYLHALVTRCDSVWLVTVEGWEENPDVQQVLTWARQHALRVNRWSSA
jgi:hypothetical protein